MRAEEVAASILDIAFARDAPPPALNIVNPRGAPWVDVMTAIQGSILELKSLKSNELPTVSFQEWFSRLESRAEGASSEDLVNIVSMFYNEVKLKLNISGSLL